MKKGYMVYKSCICSDDSEDVCMFLDIQKGMDYVKEMNIPSKKEDKIMDKCYECTKHDYDEEKPYKFKNTCDRACIKSDRYGEYCENEMVEYYQKTQPTYYGREIEIR